MTRDFIEFEGVATPEDANLVGGSYCNLVLDRIGP
jgi:hypothetical protein